MSDTNNSVTVNSRTLSVKNTDEDFDDCVICEYLENTTITYLDSGNVYLQCDTVEDAQSIYDLLTDAGKKVRIVSYSLFFRSADEMTEDDARSIFESMGDINIVYVRVDANNHTGKLVVDTWDDYKVFKEYEDEEKSIKFYHFDPRAKSKIRKGRKNRGKNSSEDESDD
jgi:hypothetical protein